MVATTPSDRRPRRPSLVARAMLGAVRVGFSTYALFAPEQAERRAAEIFATPRKRPKTQRDRSSAQRLPFKDGTIAVWVDGPEDGPTVLMSHGWEGNAESFAELRQGLIRSGARVVSFDHRAHGWSSGRRATLLDFRDGVRAVAAHVGPLHALVGHSIGGAAAVFALDDEAVQPERVVLVAPAREPSRFVHAAAGLLGLKGERRAGMVAKVSEEIGKFADLDVAKWGASRREPLLIVHAANDGTIPVEESECIAKSWPDARLIVRSEGAHRRVLRDQDVVAAVVDFVLRHDRSDEPPVNTEN